MKQEEWIRRYKDCPLLEAEVCDLLDDWTADREALQAEAQRERRHRGWALRAAREWMHTYRAHGKSLQAEVKRLREALGECCDLSGRCAAKYGALTLAEGELKRLRKILRRWSDKEKA